MTVTNIQSIVKMLMVICFIQAQGVPTVNIYVTGGNEVQRGSTNVLVCNYTKPVNNTLVLLKWSYGQKYIPESITELAAYYLYSNPNVFYYDPISPPTYVMTIDGIDNGYSGSSTLTIASTLDSRRYWCDIWVQGYNTNPTASVDLIVRDTQNVQVSVSVQGSNTKVPLGSQVILICEYTYDPKDIILTIGWQRGQMEGVRTTIAVIYTPRPLDPIYSYDDYQPPAYVMTANGQPGQGRSDLIIESVDWVDDGEFWCTVVETNGGIDIDSVVLSVTDFLPNATEGMSTVTANPTTDTIDTQNVHVSLSVQGSYTEVSLGSQVTLICEYTYDPKDTIESTGWQKSQTEENPIAIAFYAPPLGLIYSTDDYQPPEYTMTVNGQPGQGRSDLIIESVDWVDDGKFWCTVSEIFGGFDIDSVVLSVRDFLPNATEGMSTVTVNPTTDMIELSTHQATRSPQDFTTTITSYIDIIRVEANWVEISWESFEVNNNEVTEFRVFYSIGFHTNVIGSSVVFIDREEKGVTITDLIPDTLYSVKVEASTKQGSLIKVGNFHVTTIGADSRTGSKTITICIGVAVAFILVVGLTAICLIRWRLSTSQKAPRDREYELTIEDTRYHGSEPRTLDLGKEPLAKPNIYETFT